MKKKHGVYLSVFVIISGLVVVLLLLIERAGECSDEWCEFNDKVSGTYIKDFEP